MAITLDTGNRSYPVNILYKFIAGRYRPVRVADGPITARYRYIKDASPHRSDSNEYTQHTFARYKKKISLNYPHIVFGGNLCGLQNVFDSSMVNEPSGFEPLKFYYTQIY